MKVIVTTLVAGVVWFGAWLLITSDYVSFRHGWFAAPERLNAVRHHGQGGGALSSDLPCDGVSSPNLARAIGARAGFLLTVW